MLTSSKFFQLSIFALLSVLFRRSANANEKNSTDSRSEPEVLKFGGLFAIHGYNNGTSFCGPFTLGGFIEMNAMLFAVSKVNQNEDLLPGMKLQANVEDTCSSTELATEKSLHYTTMNYRSVSECLGNRSAEEKPILAIVGAQSSDVSRAVTNLVGLFHIPVISYAATSSSLSGVKYFARTVPPDTYATQALIDVLQRFQWNYVILLYSNSEYGRFAAESFREKLRKLKENRRICIAVDEHIQKDASEDLQTWEKIHNERDKTKVVVVFAIYDDFNGFLQTGKGKHDLEKYIWLSNDIWNRQTANLTCMLKHAISIIPSQIHIDEFEEFFYNAQKYLQYMKQHSSFDEKWFEEYRSSVAPGDFNMSSSKTEKSACVAWSSSEVSYVMDAVYTIAWALHDLLECDNNTKTCNKTESINIFKRKLLKAIKSVDFQNVWTMNKVSFTPKGNPRNVKYSIVSFQKEEECFVNIGHWSCVVDVNEACTGNLTLEESFTPDIFLGVCGVLCTEGQYKIVGKQFAYCCWKCQNCTANGYSDKPGTSTCLKCKHDEWPTENRTSCVKVKPRIVFLTKNPAGIFLLCVNILSIKILILFVILIIKYSKSKMKIFKDRILCYILLFGILICNVVSIFILTDAHKDYCLLMVIFAKVGSTCTLGTIFIKTNDVYRTYKKKILKDDPRFLSESLKAMVVICLVIIDVALLWFGINFEGKNRKTSTTLYFPTETGNTAYIHCGFIIDFITGDVFTVLENSFYWALLLICTHQSYLIRKVTDHAHGLRYVFFGSLALTINSVSLLLVQSFTDDKGYTKELIYSFYHSFFAAVALACTFIPKVEILVFHPEKDVLFDALRATAMTGQVSEIGMTERRKSNENPPCASGIAEITT